MFSNNQFLDTTNSQEESNSNNYKQVEYDFIDTRQDGSYKINNGDNKHYLNRYYEKQVIPILRPLNNLGNKYLLGNDLYINIDLILYEDGEDQQKSLISQFKKIESVEWNQKRQFVKMQLETSKQYTYDFSLLIYQLSTLQNSKYASCIAPLKKYEQFCLAQYQANQNMRRSYFDYDSKVQQYVQQNRDNIIQSIDFTNKYIFILERAFDGSNNQFSLQSTRYSEKLLDLLGVYHGLNMFGQDRTEMANMLIRLGVVNIFNNITSMDYTINFFLNQKLREEGQSDLNFDFFTLDNIHIQCKGKRVQHNIKLDLDYQQNQNNQQYLQTCLMIVYELYIPSDLISQINSQRLQQLRYFSKITDKLTQQEAKQYCVNGSYPEECKPFLKKYYKEVLNKEVKNINSNFYDLSWLNNF